MNIKLRLEGAVNGHPFLIEGKGNGQPLEGTQDMRLTVKEGGPLPFSYDILTTVFDYGNRVSAKYPDDIIDYFKLSFPEGYSWERSIVYEDGGICVATSDIKLLEDEENCFYYKIRFDGVNFPANSPVRRTLRRTLRRPRRNGSHPLKKYMRVMEC